MTLYDTMTLTAGWQDQVGVYTAIKIWTAPHDIMTTGRQNLATKVWPQMRFQDSLLMEVLKI